MQTGTKISGIGHAALIGFVLFGGVFSSDPIPMEVAEVSLISSEQFAALSSPREAPEVVTAPEVPEETPGAPEVVEPPEEPAPVAEPEPEPQPEPEPIETVQPEPEPTPEPETPAAEPAPPAPEVEAVETPEPPAPEASVVPDTTSVRPEPRPVDRVAPEAVAPPPPEATPDEVEQTEVAPEDGAETPQEPQEATAPREATDRVVPEPVVEALAPTASRRPPSGSRPERPSPVQTAAPAPETAAPSTPAPAPRDTSTAVDSALAEALGSPQPSAPAPVGPPLNEGEKEALRVAVSRCWNVGSLSSAAMATTVVVSVSMGQDGMPNTNSIRMLSSSGGDSNSARQAFEAARRAIIRCASGGYDLPAEKYAQWRDIEMTFNPERMRVR